MSYRTITPAEAKTLLDQGWTYVDVRTVEEFAAGHPPGAYNVPFAVRSAELGRMAPNPDFADVMAKAFDPAARLVVGCAAGGRSMHACEVLAEAGFTNLANMHGGYAGARDMHGQMREPGWSTLGYPTTTQPHPERTYDRLRG